MEGVNAKRPPPLRGEAERGKIMKVSIIGTGHIAHSMARTIKVVDEAEFYAVASRTLEAAEKFAEEFDIPKAYGSYDELINDPEIELVYIATIHPLHYELSKKLLEKGKSVLCEKPICINSAHAEDLFRIAREHNAFICEAVWTRFFPWVKEIKEIISSGEIGKPVLMQSNFGSKKTASSWIHDPKLGGGALLDLGIYNVTAASMLLGDDFEIEYSVGKLSEAGVDDHSLTVIKYKNGVTASLMSCTDMCTDSKITLMCENGIIEIAGVSNWKSTRVYNEQKELIREITPKFKTGYVFELEACIKAIKEGKIECAEMPHSESLFVLGVMDDMRARWGMKYPGE